MNISRITDEFFVAPQISMPDFRFIADQGFKTVINCRPDGEQAGAMLSVQASEGAKEHGLGYYHIPVAMNGISPNLVEEFSSVLRGLSGPALAYCASGRRAAILWALASAGQIPVADIIANCAQAGHDVSQIAPVLQQRAQFAA